MEHHVDGDRETILAAIEIATQQLVHVNTQLEQLQLLQQRARHLDAFIRLGHALLGDEQPPQLPESPQETARPHQEAFPHEPPSGRKRTAAEYARSTLEAFQRPMRAQEMAEYVQRLGLMQGQYVGEVLRTAMRKHPAFECISAGLYALKAWPPVLKAVPAPHTSSL